jgi:hypothetical protein
MKTAKMMRSRPESAASRALQLFMIASLITLMAGFGASAAFAEEEEIPFEEAEIYFELNDTDGDLGIHSLIDGEPWKHLEIEDPRGRQMLNIFVQGRLRRQGLTEIFFESAEPTFDELAPRRFFRRFPEGEYEIEGLTLEGQEMESVAELTHLLPAPPANVQVNGAPVSEDCEVDPGPEVSSAITVTWDPVTLSHPELGITSAPIEVILYQVVVEDLVREITTTMEVLPPEEPDEMAVELPATLTAPGGEFKIEIIVREESGNQTAMESCFTVVVD